MGGGGGGGGGAVDRRVAAGRAEARRVFRRGDPRARC